MESQTLEVKKDTSSMKRFAYFFLFLGTGFIWLSVLAIIGTFVIESNLDLYIWLFFVFTLTFGIFFLVVAFLRFKSVKK